MTDIVHAADRSPLTHHQAMQLQATELERTLDLLRSLDPVDWSAPTDCPAWDVRRMYLHVLGACEAGASMKENLHQMRAAKARQKTEGEPLEANLSALQVQERLDLTADDLVDRLAAVAPVTVRKRTSTPGLMRRVRIKIDGPVVEKWALGYLMDTIYLRDLWMHRVDACRATGREMVLSADHDGTIVADVVAEWARRHGQPFTLTLTGPAGGRFTAGPGTAAAPVLELDAVEFCRMLAGRSSGTGLLDTVVPF
jgi:uncharacterized protein (TIGR03083 family)